MTKLIIIISGIQQTSGRITSPFLKSNKIFYHNAYTNDKDFKPSLQ